MSLSLHDTVSSIRTTAVDVTILKPQIPQIVKLFKRETKIIYILNSYFHDYVHAVLETNVCSLINNYFSH